MEIRNEDEMVKTLKTLANPIRLRILSSLYGNKKHIYALSKELHLSYPLIHLYLESLEEIGLVKSQMEGSTKDERERKFYSIVSFEISVTPESIAKMYSESEKK